MMEKNARATAERFNRRGFLRRAGLGAAAFGAVSTLAKAADARRKPNILLIVGDDQGHADMSCTGLAPDVKTPNLDALAKRGVRFTQAYAASPICSASRAALITGSYQQRFGNYWYGGPGIDQPRFTTIPELLEKQGYATGYVGKFHYGRDHGPDHRNFPLNHGFGSFYGFSGGRKHYLRHEAEAEAKFMAVKKAYKRGGQSLQQGPMWDGVERKDAQGLSTELFGERARAFIRENKERPFFLQLAFNAVHNFTHQLPKEYMEKHGIEGHHDWDPAKEEYYDWYQQGRYPNNPEGRAQYLGQLHYLDKEIGRVLETLDDTARARDTLVIYIGDNGGSTPIYANNTPLRGSKYTLYEGGIRVPMIVSWPARFEQGVVRDNVVSAMDVLPTVCRAAGAAAPGHIDGMDLTALLNGEDPALHHETLVWDTKKETAVRQGDWKLKTATDKSSADHEMVELELGEFLYNLKEDPGEENDVAGEYPEVFQRLKAVHARWSKNL